MIGYSMRHLSLSLLASAVALTLTLVACGDPPAGEPIDQINGEAQEAGPDLDAGVPAQEPIDLRTVEFSDDLDLDIEAMTESDTGLFWMDREVGSGEEARVGSLITVHYTGWLAEEGEVFEDSRELGDPFEVQLGVEPLIPGFEEGVEGMRQGGTRLLLIPPHLAYGATGAEGVIPANAVLAFEVELIEVEITGDEG